ncbi:SocA family protein [Pseudaminobacter sp. 19-2017]|uniref:SocA family protein n=2 Tax=Pseudaminobacter soli (ex Zhang et al. 2022) TaxID=2831468 RepID=A0A942E0V0_9HYPH|nr:SocA family protein [Pseudaminobacter soli]
MAYDVRAVANYVLDVADGEGRGISNLHINKIVYFLHADFLATFSRPLVTAKIEAWTHGPVFRELYHQFKAFGESYIVSRATCIDPQTGQRITASCDLTAEDETFLNSILPKYIAMSPGALVAQSHVRGGPWDTTWNHDNRANPTMKISDDLIREWYQKTAKH